MQKLIWVPSELKRLWGCSDSFWSGGSSLEPSSSLWSGDSFWSPPGSSGALGAETPFGAPSLALLERRLFFRALLAPFGTETPSGAPLALLEPLERRLLLEPLWLFWSGGSSSEPLWLPLERRLALEPL